MGKKWNEYRELAPDTNYRAGSSGGYSPSEILARRVAICCAVLAASLTGLSIIQRRDLASLPECDNLRGNNGVGDFLGVKHLKLVKFARVVDGKRDFEIPAGPWHTFKCWDWLRTNAPDTLAEVATENGFASAKEAEAHILAQIDDDSRKEGEGTVVSATQRNADEEEDKACTGDEDFGEEEELTEAEIVRRQTLPH